MSIDAPALERRLERADETRERRRETSRPMNDDRAVPLLSAED